MAIHIRARGASTRPKRQTAKTARIPAPYKGVDSRTPFAAGAQDVCIYSYNLVPNDGGVALRKGYGRYQTELDDGNGLSVNTIIPFDGTAADGSEDRLFAATNEGIWDCSVEGATPVLKVTFSDQREDAGYGAFITYITDGADKVMLFADSFNGLFTYDVATDAWAQSTGITGPTEANINFVTVHKQRIWLIERDSADAWYLDMGAITGTATQFFFGSKLRNGGALRGLFSWTVDGGKGVDDLFVGVSGAGDVIVYQGDDPSAAALWAIRGVYYIGTLPRGPNFATEQGGELYLLSTFGVISMTDLLNGVAISSSQQNNATARIAGELRQRLSKEGSESGWAIRSIPSEGGILISTPVRPGGRAIQYYYNLTVGGWGFWRDLDIRSFNTWKSTVVFGDGSLRVLFMNKELDDVIFPPTPGVFNGVPIEFSILTSFSALEAPALFKRVKFIRPDVISSEEPVFAVAARYDYALTEGTIPISLAPPSVDALWDADLWNLAVWGTANFTQGFDTVFGAEGIGRTVAIAYRGEAYKPFTLVGWDVIYDAGGPML